MRSLVPRLHLTGRIQVSSHASVADLSELLHWDLEQIEWAVDKFKVFDTNGDGLLDMTEFCRGFRLDQDDPHVQLLFRSLDKATATSN